MSLASFVANKFFAYLLSGDAAPAGRQAATRRTLPRPPWSLAAEAFHSCCTGCSACVAACPKQLIVLDESGLPTVDFSKGSCTFCGRCARSCAAGALRFDPALRPWEVRAAVDAAACLLAARVLCQSCGERCGKGAIVFMPGALRQPTILPDKCDGCGVCGSVCPAGAIFFTSASDAAQ